MIAGAIVEKVEWVERKFRKVGAGKEDTHDALGLSIWQALEQHAVNDAEDGAIGPDAERERENDDQREGWIGPELTHCIFRIVERELDEAGATHIAAVFLGLFMSAEGEPCASGCFFLIHAAMHVLFDLMIEMGTQLVF